MSVLIKLENVGKHFLLDGRELKILDSVSMALDRGQSMAVVGKSGAGKSTLLTLMGTLDKPTSGSILIGGEDPHTLSDEKLSSFRAKNIGFVFQSHLLLPEFSAIENVALPSMIAGKSKKEAFDKSEELLGSVGLADRLSHRPGKLSGGEQQRVAIARSLANSPSLLLADEPTGNLDTKTGGEVFDLIVNMAESRNLALVVVTHDMGIARSLGSISAIEDGKVTNVTGDMLE